MAHSEHNRSKNSGGFALIILGALLLFLAPNINPTSSELGTMALIGGIIIGAIGFYIKFIKNRPKKV
ncbi:hypothetical protein NsoK4_05405 [Nitrosopumilus sp. K4]|uniref:hypothetical protein n=1 Tax=Nitrosopumilus sp. K4 TaxID=2795383 RepID=UPI001BADB30A|nr:hypothetical protein [Nitrosopumilus sp. K4]QUC63901.1 hypothetical protein NsoK4_05405 [Nitrosopumilus sp. K4]